MAHPKRRIPTRSVQADHLIELFAETVYYLTFEYAIFAKLSVEPMT